jgi:hypothetical protein
MDYEIWEKYKDELQNESCKPFCMFSNTARYVIRDAAKAGAIIEVLDSVGVFRRKQVEGFQSGHIYRISPAWPGPAKPEPETEYMDESISSTCGSYRVCQPGLRFVFLGDAVNHVDFAGYVYEINGVDRCRPRLLFDSLPDGTFRLRVPKAVRFLKGAV